MKKSLFRLTILFCTIIFSQLNMTAYQIYNTEFEYNLTEYVPVDLTFSFGTELDWIERKAKADANEKLNTIHLNKQTMPAGWNEADHTKISLYPDFMKGSVWV